MLSTSLAPRPPPPVDGADSQAYASASWRVASARPGTGIARMASSSACPGLEAYK